MPNRFHHTKDIKETQSATIKSIIPGMILTFRYEGKNVFDKYPLILFLYRDPKKNLIDGLNLNYLSDYRFKQFFEDFKDRTKVSTRDEETSNLLGEDYTFISIPPIPQVSRTASRSERKVEMKRMYDKFIAKRGKANLNKIYRSYSVKNIKSLKVVNLEDY
jgi:hypothetical protein